MAASLLLHTFGYFNWGNNHPKHPRLLFNFGDIVLGGEFFSLAESDISINTSTRTCTHLALGLNVYKSVSARKRLIKDTLCHNTHTHTAIHRPIKQ